VAGSVASVLHSVRSLRSAIQRPNGGGGRSRGLSGWMAVTVLRPPDEVDVQHLPAPLAALGDQIEVRVQPASQDRGTELAARLRDAPRGSRLDRLGGKDAEAHLRQALRESKQLLEVGEVLAVDPTPHGQRTSTPGGALIERWTTAAPRGGVR
jgi:hypothetical protein